MERSTPFHSSHKTQSNRYPQCFTGRLMSPIQICACRWIVQWIMVADKIWFQVRTSTGNFAASVERSDVVFPLVAYYQRIPQPNEEWSWPHEAYTSELRFLSRGVARRFPRIPKIIIHPSLRYKIKKNILDARFSPRQFFPRAQVLNYLEKNFAQEKICGKNAFFCFVP